MKMVMLFGNELYRYDTNIMILLSAIKFCMDSESFDLPLFLFDFISNKAMRLSQNKTDFCLLVSN